VNTPQTPQTKPIPADPNTMVDVNVEISKDYQQFVSPTDDAETNNTMFKACPDHVAFNDAQGTLGPATRPTNWAAAPFQTPPPAKGQSAAPGL